jgi:hypothetical protein
VAVVGRGSSRRRKTCSLASEDHEVIWGRGIDFGQECGWPRIAEALRGSRRLHRNGNQLPIDLNALSRFACEKPKARILSDSEHYLCTVQSRMTHPRPKTSNMVYANAEKIIKTLRRLQFPSSTYYSPVQVYAPDPATAGIGQSSSVILDQNIHTITTASNVKREEKRPPLILPEVPVQM